MNQINHNELEWVTANITDASTALVDHLTQHGNQISLAAAWGLQSRVAQLQSLIDNQYAASAPEPLPEPVPDRQGGRDPLLAMEVPIRRIRGQAAALHSALCEELPDDPLLGAAESLAVAADELAEQWDSIHEAGRGNTD